MLHVYLIQLSLHATRILQCEITPSQVILPLLQSSTCKTDYKLYYCMGYYMDELQRPEAHGLDSVVSSNRPTEVKKGVGFV